VRAAIVGRDDLDILVVFPAIAVPIFDAQIRKMDLVIEIREVVFVGPFPDLGLGPIRVAVVVVVLAIALMEPALVLAF
jgi:hypothetical protein